MLSITPKRRPHHSHTPAGYVVHCTDSLMVRHFDTLAEAATFVYIGEALGCLFPW